MVCVDTCIGQYNYEFTYIVGTYSPGKELVVYDMSIHVLPTAPSPTTTHFMSLSVLAILWKGREEGRQEGKGEEEGGRETGGRRGGREAGGRRGGREREVGRQEGREEGK